MPLFRIDRHAGVVAHVLVGPGSDVEQGGLPAVGIAHERDADYMVPLLGQMGEGAVQPFAFGHFLGQALQVLVADEGFAGFVVIDHFDQIRLFAPEGNLVTDDFVFNRIPERCVQHHRHLLPLDEAHLDEALPEGTVAMDPDNDRLFAGLEFG